MEEKLAKLGRLKVYFDPDQKDLVQGLNRSNVKFKPVVLSKKFRYKSYVIIMKIMITDDETVGVRAKILTDNLGFVPIRVQDSIIPKMSVNNNCYINYNLCSDEVKRLVTEFCIHYSNELEHLITHNKKII